VADQPVIELFDTAAERIELMVAERLDAVGHRTAMRLRLLGCWAALVS
jgi:hypothetical protein